MQQHGAVRPRRERRAQLRKVAGRRGRDGHERGADEVQAELDAQLDEEREFSGEDGRVASIPVRREIQEDDFRDARERGAGLGDQRF